MIGFYGNQVTLLLTRCLKKILTFLLIRVYIKLDQVSSFFGVGGKKKGTEKSKRVALRGHVS